MCVSLFRRSCFTGGCPFLTIHRDLIGARRGLGPEGEPRSQLNHLPLSVYIPFNGCCVALLCISPQSRAPLASWLTLLMANLEPWYEHDESLVVRTTDSAE